MVPLMNDEQNIGVIYKGDPAPTVYRATIIDHFVNWIWNLARKPKVWRSQKELIKLANEIQEDIRRNVCPELLANLLTCQQCREAYALLKSQVFLSQTEQVFLRSSCTRHKKIFDKFMATNAYKFRKSEEIARYINGFTL